MSAPLTVQQRGQASEHVVATDRHPCGAIAQPQPLVLNRLTGNPQKNRMTLSQSRFRDSRRRDDVSIAPMSLLVKRTGIEHLSAPSYDRAA
jgi:hypothetical protein